MKIPLPDHRIFHHKIVADAGFARETIHGCQESVSNATLFGRFNDWLKADQGLFYWRATLVYLGMGLAADTISQLISLSYGTLKIWDFARTGALCLIGPIDASLSPIFWKFLDQKLSGREGRAQDGAMAPSANPNSVMQMLARSSYEYVGLNIIIGSSPFRVGDFGLILDFREHAGENFQAQVLLVA